MEKTEYIEILKKLELRIKDLEDQNQYLNNQNQQLQQKINENSTKGYVYKCKIIDDDRNKFYYIGSTNEFEKRVKEHIYLAKRNSKSNFHQKLNQINFDNEKFKFKPIESYEKILKYDLLRKEKEYYNEFKNKGYNMLNDMELFIGNPNKNNKDHRKEYEKTRYEKNKANKKAQYQKLKIKCSICGGIYTEKTKAKHDQIKKHQKNII